MKNSPRVKYHPRNKIALNKVRGVRSMSFRVLFKKVKLLFFTLLLFSIPLSIYYVLFKTNYFLIENIEIQGASRFVNSTDLWYFVKSNQEGKNILFFNTEEFSNRVKSRFLGANSVSIRKDLPDTLVVVIEERIPMALLRNENSPEYYMVDVEGYLLGTVQPDYESLPKVDYVGDLRVGEFVSKDIVSVYYDLIEALEANQIKTSSMSFHDDHVVFYTPESVRVLVGGRKDKLSAMSALSKLLKSLQLEDKNPNSIDLRYDKVVVSY